MSEISPFLAGNFAPVPEERDFEHLEVIGELPAELDGVFLRNGPNPQFSPPGHYHWFDGDGMLHGVHLRGGKASYRNRWIRTRGFERESAEGHAIWTGLFEMPQFDNPDGAFKNTANTALVFHAGRLLATWEGGPPHAVRAPDLSTLGLHDFDGRLEGPFTAHPKVDPGTGEMAFIGYAPLPPFLRYGVVSPDGRIAHQTEIDLEVPVMIHDMAITERHALLLDLPVVFRLEALAEGKPPFSFEPARPARIGAIPRLGRAQDVRWFEVAPCFVVHTVNAWEDGETVVLDACRMPSTDVLQGTEPQPDTNLGRLFRWRFDLATGAVKEEPLDDVACDFPRIREDRTGRRARYAYAARFQSEPAAVPLFDGLLKYDLATGRAEHHAFGPGRRGGEGVFAPRPGGREEDDGWVLTFVHDARTGRDELVVVDARDFGAAPVARVRIPGRVPYGFHATWVDGDALAAQR